MKVFMFDQICKDVRSFDALPRKAWVALGIVESVCTAGLIFPAALSWRQALTVAAAMVLAIESLVFIWVHAQHREIRPSLGLLAAFIACGMVRKPIV